LKKILFLFKLELFIVCIFLIFSEIVEADKFFVKSAIRICSTNNPMEINSEDGKYARYAYGGSCQAYCGYFAYTVYDLGEIKTFTHIYVRGANGLGCYANYCSGPETVKIGISSDLTRWECGIYSGQGLPTNSFGSITFYTGTKTGRYISIYRGPGGPARGDPAVDCIAFCTSAGECSNCLPITPPQPDLIIEDIWNVGSTIYYRIKNQGGANAGASTSKLWVDGVEKATDSVGSLAAGASSDESFATYSWSCSGASDTIKVCADVGNAVSESNENNNCREETWSCPSFDFSLSVNPNSGTVTQGGSVTTTVTANLISGTSQPVSFSCGGGNWLTGWQYRKPITITERSGNALTNYQVLVSLDTASLISANKMRNDCGDIRFTDSDGTTLLNYWIESGCNSANTKIWVNVPSFQQAQQRQFMFIMEIQVQQVKAIVPTCLVRPFL